MTTAIKYVTIPPRKRRIPASIRGAKIKRRNTPPAAISTDVYRCVAIRTEYAK